MSEYAPDDSRDVTNSQARAPGEPPRTGPREDQARARAGQMAGGGQGQQADEPAEAGGPKDIEGDSPEHPDRMGAFTGETADGQQETQDSARTEGEGDRWHRKAEDAGG